MDKTMFRKDCHGCHLHQLISKQNNEKTSELKRTEWSRTINSNLKRNKEDTGKAAKMRKDNDLNKIRVHSTKKGIDWSPNQ